jgi:hypothetical protein
MFFFVDLCQHLFIFSIRASSSTRDIPISVHHTASEKMQNEQTERVTDVRSLAHVVKEGLEEKFWHPTHGESSKLSQSNERLPAASDVATSVTRSSAVCAAPQSSDTTLLLDGDRNKIAEAAVSPPVGKQREQKQQASTQPRPTHEDCRCRGPEETLRPHPPRDDGTMGSFECSEQAPRGKSHSEGKETSSPIDAVTYCNTRVNAAPTGRARVGPTQLTTIEEFLSELPSGVDSSDK